MKDPSILIIDDEQEMCSSLEEIFQDEGFHTCSTTSPTQALEILSTHCFSLILMDLRMPEIGGIELLKAVKNEHCDVPVIMITGYPTVETAVRTMKYGAANYYTKPLKLNSLITEAKQLAEARGTRETASNSQNSLIASDPSMDNIKKTINTAGEVDAPVMINGESGTGKELIAQAIHAASNRFGQPFVRVNCAAIPESLIESELFGHEAGAFTDAKSMRKGKFEMAHGGTLFLDEIGDMSFATQARILHALQEKTFERVGGSTSITTDCRILAATHRDLQRMIQNGTFREDLYYRLAVITVQVPPLRQRNSDIELLCTHFIQLFNHKYTRSIRGISSEVLSFFTHHSWPGNVRELRNCIERAVIFATDAVIKTEDLPSQYIQAIEASQTSGKQAELEKLNQEIINDALFKSGGVKTKAAELLNISRRTLYYRMKRLGME